MPPQNQSSAFPLSLFNITKGLITAESRTQIANEACRACSNVVGKFGKVVPRPGFRKIAQLPQLPSGYAVVHFGVINGDLSLMQGVYAVGKLRTTPYTQKVFELGYGGAWSWTDRTGAATFAGGAGTQQLINEYANSCIFKDTVYLAINGGNLYKYTPGGNIVEVVNANPAITPCTFPQFVSSWDGRLWILGGCTPSVVPRRSSLVAWSDFLLDNVWQGGVNGGASGYQELIEVNTDPITGVVDLRDHLMVFKPTAIYLGSYVDAPKYFEFRKLSRSIGCVAPRSIAQCLDTVFFVGVSNVYMIKGGQEPVPIGNPIVSTLATLFQSYTSAHGLITGVVDEINRIYYLFLPSVADLYWSTGSGAPGMVPNILAYNMTDGSWWQGTIANSAITPLCANSALRIVPFPVTAPIPDGLLALSGGWTKPAVVVGSYDGNFYQFTSDVTTDSGTAYTCSWTSKTLDAMQASGGHTMVLYGRGFETQQVQRVALHAASGKASVTVNMGDNLDALTIHAVGQLTMDGKSPKYLAVAQAGRFVEIGVSGVAATWPPLEGLTLHIMDRGSVR